MRSSGRTSAASSNTARSASTAPTRTCCSDLLLFYSSTEKKPVTLAEYVSRMKEDQKYLYYAAGESLDKIDKLPQTELLKDKRHGDSLLHGGGGRVLCPDPAHLSG